MRAFVIHDNEGNLVSTAILSDEIEEGDLEIEVSDAQRKEGLQVSEVDLPESEEEKGRALALDELKEKFDFELSTKKLTRRNG